MPSASLNPLPHRAIQAKAMSMVSIGGYAAIHFRRRIGCLQGGYDRRYSVAGATQLR